MQKFCLYLAVLLLFQAHGSWASDDCSEGTKPLGKRSHSIIENATATEDTANPEIPGEPAAKRAKTEDQASCFWKCVHLSPPIATTN